MTRVEIPLLRSVCLVIWFFSSVFPANATHSDGALVSAVPSEPDFQNSDSDEGEFTYEEDLESAKLTSENWETGFRNLENEEGEKRGQNLFPKLFGYLRNALTSSKTPVTKMEKNPKTGFPDHENSDEELEVGEDEFDEDAMVDDIEESLEGNFTISEGK